MVGSCITTAHNDMIVRIMVTTHDGLVCAAVVAAHWSSGRGGIKGLMCMLAGHGAVLGCRKGDDLMVHGFGLRILIFHSHPPK